MLGHRILVGALTLLLIVAGQILAGGGPRGDAWSLVRAGAGHVSWAQDEEEAPAEIAPETAPVAEEELPAALEDELAGEEDWLDPTDALQEDAEAPAGADVGTFYPEGCEPFLSEEGEIALAEGCEPVVIEVAEPIYVEGCEPFLSEEGELVSPEGCESVVIEIVYPEGCEPFLSEEGELILPEGCEPVPPADGEAPVVIEEPVPVVEPTPEPAPAPPPPPEATPTLVPPIIGPATATPTPTTVGVPAAATPTAPVGATATATSAAATPFRPGGGFQPTPAVGPVAGGVWSGTTSQGRPFSLTVDGNAVTSITFSYLSGGCADVIGQVSTRFEAGLPRPPIREGRFTAVVLPSGAPAIGSVEGTFQGSSAVQGTFRITEISLALGQTASPCGSVSEGSWTATPQ